MPSKGNGREDSPLYQTSILCYTTPKPRKSIRAAAPHTNVSRLRHTTPSSSRTGTLAKFGDTRPHPSPSSRSTTPMLISALGGSSSRGTPREVNKKTPSPTVSMINLVSSSPIPGPTQSQCHHNAQTGNRVVPGSEHGDTPQSHSTVSFSKRKTRDWLVEDHPQPAYAGCNKRRRRPSSSSSDTYHSPSSRIAVEDSSTTLNLCHSQMRKKVPSRTSPPTPTEVRQPFLLEEDDKSYVVIESSQTQPLLTPVRPAVSSPQTNAPSGSPQVHGDDTVRSSQSPSPLKLTVPYSASSFILDSSSHQLLTLSSLSREPFPPDVSVVKRRRAPEPGTVSLFGVRGVGVRSSPNSSLVSGSLSNNTLLSTVKLTRRPGRYSIPHLVDLNHSATEDTSMSSDRPKSPPFPSQVPPSTPSLMHSDASPQRTASNLLAESESFQRLRNQTGDSGPFWETQPLLDIDLDLKRSSSSSQLTRPPLSPHLSRHQANSPLRAPNGGRNLHQSKTFSDSGSETEPDDLFAPSYRHASPVDPDKTTVASIPGHRNVTKTAQIPFCPSHDSVPDTRRSLVIDGSPQVHSEINGAQRDNRGSGDKPKPNTEGNTAGGQTCEKGEVDIGDVTRGLEDLSPFKRAEKHPDGSKQIPQSHHPKGIGTSNAFLGNLSGHLPVARHRDLPLNEETQDDQTFTQLWPGASLPAGWNSFETPKKPQQTSRVKLPRRDWSKSLASATTFKDGKSDVESQGQDEDDSDDVFGPEVTPRTLARERPDVVCAFETLPSPYAGMFSGSVEGESGDDSDV